MHTLSRLSEPLRSRSERGGEVIAGCSPFGSQRTVAAPRSNTAVVGQRVHRTVGPCGALQGELGLFGKAGAASRSAVRYRKAPNPALKRTCLRQAA